MRHIPAVFVAALLLTGCGSAAGVKEDKPTPGETTYPNQVKVEPAPTVTAQDGLYTLDETATYKSGIKVSLTGFKRGTSSDVASPRYTPYVSFTVRIKNGSTARMDLSEASLTCLYGEPVEEGREIYDFTEELKKDIEGIPDITLLPGKEVKALAACEMPRNKRYLQAEVDPGWELGTSIFTGKIKK